RCMLPRSEHRIERRGASMELIDTPQEAAFRAEVRTFIKEHGSKARPGGNGGGRGEDAESGWSADYRERTKGWRDALGERGWIAPAWPKEYGGAGLTAKEQFILNEELAENGLSNAGGFGVMMLGPTLMVHGNDEQKQDR